MAHIEMTLASMEAFLNDGKLDLKELDNIVSLAEADGEISEEEISVLKSVIQRIKPEEIDGKMQRRIEEISKKFGL